MVTFANLGSVRLPSLKFVKKGKGTYSSSWNSPQPSRSEDTAHLVCQLYIYNIFPVIRTTIAKNRHFYVPRPSFVCLPWRRPCGNHAKRCMNETTIQCLPNPSQHVPIYLQQFSSYSNRKCKKIAVLTYHSPHFCFPWRSTPLWLSRNMLHGWKDNSMLAKPLAACRPTYLSLIVSELYDA